MKTYHCFFEQSGTFKNEFKKLKHKAFDYDISNEFNETDFVIDLFSEIEKAYENKSSIFDKIQKEDTIIAFFPCIRFENQVQLLFRGTAFQQKKWNNEQKLEYDLRLHRELSNLYEIVTKMVIVCLNRKIPLIIENPYSTTHYLTKYWAIPSTFVDKDRTLRGDFYEKPTQYWFINCKPSYNMILEAYSWNKKKDIGHTNPRSREKFNFKRICKQIYTRIYFK